MSHFPDLPADVTARLAAIGIDPERSAESWLETILDGSFPLNADGTPARPSNHRGRGERSEIAGRHAANSPGWRHVPTPIPLAVVIP